MVRKEKWGRLLVYSLVRAVMAEAAYRKGVQPREVSVHGARQVMKGFRAELARAPSPRAVRLRADALSAIDQERVGDRPDRYEPRARKRREKIYPRLREPRPLAGKRLEIVS